MVDYNGPERRRKLRIREPFPVKIDGVNKNGQAFHAETVIESLSAGGLSVSLQQDVEQGSKLTAVIQFSGGNEPGACVAANCEVLRVKPRTGGEHEVAAVINRYRFLDTKECLGPG